ncbi:MAG: GNAT family acetyltransferase [Planctomycetota bacterium]|nr:GNAT family acetyltransferase [Planctomycetota bacterium]
MQIRQFQPGDEPGVISLWQECDLIRPLNDPHKDIHRKLSVNPEMFLIGFFEGIIVASVMAGYEGHRGWLNYLAVAPEFRGRGFGKQMVAAAEDLLQNAGCPKINLQVRVTNPGVIAFYQRIGYSVDDVVSMGKRMEQ